MGQVVIDKLLRFKTKRVNDFPEWANGRLHTIRFPQTKAKDDPFPQNWVSRPCSLHERGHS